MTPNQIAVIENLAAMMVIAAEAYEQKQAAHLRSVCVAVSEIVASSHVDIPETLRSKIASLRTVLLRHPELQ